MAELYVVATPIGNLQDMTPRMQRALSSCDLIAAEDTRVTMKLLNHLGIKKPLVSCHRHNEAQRAGALVERMIAEDLVVCLTCDAGTPGISDPGVELVREAVAAGVRVTPVCGPSAVTAHLSACGFDARTFGFYGFLPREKCALMEKLREIGRAGLPVAVFYESPHRVVRLCEAILEALPDCRLSVACDISKLYERILTGDCAGVLAALRDNPNVEKGEYCVAVEIPPAPPVEARTDMPAEAHILMELLSGASMNEAADAAAQAGCPRNDVYRAKLRVKKFLEEQDGM